ncbi:MAG: isoleucine--tRNA ligase [Halanaerobiales bacterium]|nr:isoleucine--tRNA ligase [Halanaerobiales bacterium]
MAKFKEVNLKNSVNDRENEILQYWRDNDIATKSVTSKEGKPQFVFFEGPPTANGKPGIHHVLSRTLKDSVCRYKTMQGYQVNRKAGWDTHGLPVEIEVEKQLGLSSKKDIEEYGLKGFNEKCRESVWTYEGLWKQMTERIGYWLDMDNPYITLDNNYIESVWWILKRFFDEDLIYEGHKIMPYCPRCGTPLASHEVSQGYKDETIDSIYIKMKVKGKDNEYFLVWTTTPWTLPSNLALCVNPKLTYVKAKVTVDESKEEYYYLVKERLGVLLGDPENYEVVEEMTGKELEGIEYEQLLPFVEVDEKAWFVICGDFVTNDGGTGIVHIAPAFGEDDYQVCRKYGLPIVQPVDKEGKFTEEITPWAGMFVKDADPKIIRHLKEQGSLFQRERMTHSYPHCWRCQTPLLYYARKSWYIKTTAYKERMIAANNKINWYPPYVGEGRFGNWLENMIDWSLSRDRYWGTPLNIWKCEECGALASVGSRQELAERAMEDVDPETIELHRPYVDDVHLKCECGHTMHRTPEVIDCWFDSGSMPYAQWHYPFENKENFGQLFPADFICEGIDQTRGWFYSLLAISTFLFDEPAYKNVMVNDMVLDKKGQKMSKSRGNAVDPWEMLDKFGADATRWYLLAVSPAWTPTRFDVDGLKEVALKFFGTLQNVYSFFTLYANIDGVNPADFDVLVSEREEIDRWVISRLNSLIKSVDENMAVYELTKVVRAIQEFVIDDLSNWYVRRCRSRFWAPDLDTNKKSVYRTLYEVLLTTAKLIAPFAPFMADEMFMNLTHGNEGSIHLLDYPTHVESYIEKDLEAHMGLVMDIVSLGRACRNSVQIKVRQPLNKILVDGGRREMLELMENLVKEELNIKDVHYIENLDEYVNYQVKPNFRVLGPKYGKIMKAIAGVLGKANAAEIIQTLRSEGVVTITVEGQEIPLTEEDLDVRVQEREGFTVEMNNQNFVILDTELDEELVEEGLAREIISKVQTMRKNSDFDIMDHIKIEFVSDVEVAEAIEKHLEYIKDETLAEQIERIVEEADDFEKWDINGHQTFIKVVRV